MREKNKRFEMRVDQAFLDKLDIIEKLAAGLRSRAAAIEFAVDVAITVLKGQQTPACTTTNHFRSYRE